MHILSIKCLVDGIFIHAMYSVVGRGVGAIALWAEYGAWMMPTSDFHSSGSASMV
jgi:hypothetical protein